MADFAEGANETCFLSGVTLANESKKHHLGQGDVNVKTVVELRLMISGPPCARSRPAIDRFPR